MAESSREKDQNKQTHCHLWREYPSIAAHSLYGYTVCLGYFLLQERNLVSNWTDRPVHRRGSPQKKPRESRDVCPEGWRRCVVCDNSEVGNEFHYLLNCSNDNVKRNRTKYVNKYYTHHPNVLKFCSLMNMISKSKNVKHAKFISFTLRYFD